MPNNFPNSFIGTWNTTWTGGTHTCGLMTISSDGSGTYSPNGTLTGSFDIGNLTYSGTYTDEGGSGPFVFVLVGTETFIGAWSFDDDQRGQWNGTADR